MLYLISYDIPDDKRRGKIANCLLDYGKRVQYSVFECNLEKEQVEQLKKEIGGFISAAEDSVRIYSFCQNCYEKIEVCGIVKEKKKKKVYIV